MRKRLIFIGLMASVILKSQNLCFAQYDDSGNYVNNVNNKFIYSNYIEPFKSLSIDARTTKI